MDLPKVSTGVTRGMLISHAKKNMGWTEAEMREAFDEWFAGCPLHREHIEENWTHDQGGT